MTHLTPPPPEGERPSGGDQLPFLPWLTLAAIADWLITRTVTRSAIFMPKSPPVLAVYQGLTLAGQLAFTLTGLLALIGIGWLAWRAHRDSRHLLALSLLGLVSLSLVFVVIAPVGWPAVGYHLLLLACVLMIGRGGRRGASMGRGRQLAWMLPATALTTAALYQSAEALKVALRLAGPLPFTSLLAGLGEFLVVASGFALWWAYGRAGALSRPLRLLPGVLALAFSAAYLLNPAMTGIMVIWSLGLTLSLPWPLYAASLWLAGLAAITSLRRGDPAGWAVLLLAAGGYLPQVSSQAFLGLIALWLLTSPEITPLPTLPPDCARSVLRRTGLRRPG